MMNGYFYDSFTPHPAFSAIQADGNHPHHSKRLFSSSLFFIPTQDPEEGTDMEHDTALSMTCYVFQI
jgi:hypothetical protein